MWLDRIDKKLNRYGESYTVRSITNVGIFKAMDSGTMRTFFDDVDISGIVRPGLILITKPSSNVIAGDTITRDSRIYTARKVCLHRVGSAVVVKVVLLT